MAESRKMPIVEINLQAALDGMKVSFILATEAIMHSQRTVHIAGDARGRVHLMLTVGWHSGAGLHCLRHSLESRAGEIVACTCKRILRGDVLSH